jgi:predicted dinucleotide-binding enzyme
MDIAILGAGKIGGTLGKKWAAAGHTIRFGVRDPHKSSIRELTGQMAGRASAGSVAEAIDFGEVVLFAIPGSAMEATIVAYAETLDGKIAIDAANKIGSTVVNSLPIFTSQTPNALVFRAFNALGWENFEDPLFDGVPADLFYTGPDGPARQKVEGLITDVGLRPVYLGGPEQTELTDDLLGLWFTLAVGRKFGRRIAFKLLQKD